MNAVFKRQLWYPQFSIGSVPMPVECTVSIVEANGKRYVKTPFAFVNAYSGDEDELQRLTLQGAGYYASAEECQAYLTYEYPHATLAQPIMEAWTNARWHSGDVVGDGRTADKCNVGLFSVPKLARGHRSFTRKQIKDALKSLREANNRS